MSIFLKNSTEVINCGAICSSRLVFTCNVVCYDCTRLQNQVDEVVDIMQSNIGKVMERGDRLEDLQDKSGWNSIISLLRH